MSQEECCARMEGMLELHNQNLRDLIFSYMLKIEKKQDALWTGLQQQASRQSQTCALEEQRLAHIESLLLQQCQSVNALEEEIRMLRWGRQQPAPFTAAANGFDNGFSQSQSAESRHLTGVLHEEPANMCDKQHGSTCSHLQRIFNVQNWPPIDQPCAPIDDSQRTHLALDDSKSPCDVITMDLDGAFRYGMPDILAPDKIVAEMTSIADFDELPNAAYDIDSQQELRETCISTEDLQIGIDNVCTVMVKNIPCSCSKQDILNAIDTLGFGEIYNFFHSPSRRGVDGNLGYAFVGFANKDMTAQFADAITGYRFQLKGRNSLKSCIVVPARIQGLKSSVEHCSKSFNHRNSPTFSM